MHKSTNPEDPLNVQELARIDEVLHRYATNTSVINASMLDGFFTAIVSGPNMILPNQWLQQIWGGEDCMPQWQTEQELGEFMGLVIRHMNHISDLLMHDPEDFQALFMIGDEGDEEFVVSLWCAGYLLAMDISPQAWAIDEEGDISEEDDDYLAARGMMHLFGSEKGHDMLASMGPEREAELSEGVEAAACFIHAYWLARRDQFTPPNDGAAPAFMGLPASNEPFIRPQVKTSRNDPCPCNSGKKYKKCCGLN